MIDGAEVGVEKIEILPAGLLRSQRDLVSEFSAVAAYLHIDLGWHYLLDLAWTADHLGPVSGLRIMDAGAGVGVMQWWLALKGAHVLSVDQASRANLSHRFRAWCSVKGIRPEDLNSRPQLHMKSFSLANTIGRWYRWPFRDGTMLFKSPARKLSLQKASGSVTIYNQELSTLEHVPSESLDAIVAISSLEHNSPDRLRSVVRELMRVLKQGGKLVATMGAAKDQDWLHKPSKGWCYTEAALRDIFDLPLKCLSNYDRYDELFEALRGCAELRDNLADFYFRSGNNGMPWGKWDPKYQPVGLFKVKKQRLGFDASELGSNHLNFR